MENTKNSTKEELLKVVPFTGQVSETTINLLKNLLQDAQDGKITQIVAIIGYNDGSVGRGWSELGRNQIRLIGEIECTKCELMLGMIDSCS